MSLEQCYQQIKDLDSNIDSLDVVREVERYRQFWRPDRVRVVLLAESHVRTSLEDFAHHWSYQADRVYKGNFVRFVYCLGYGERDLVPIASNKGTWQFWKILFSCINQVSGNRDFSTILKGSIQRFHPRMRGKIQLLEDLKRAGIWLVDASITGINGLSQNVKNETISMCWKHHIGPMMVNLAPGLEHVIIIGNGVERVLSGNLQDLGLACLTIPQPQSRLKGGYSRYFQECYEICRGVSVS
jgi:hypothetical protein